MESNKSAILQNTHVKLRSRKLADGSSSLFLDYTINDERKYEFLKLYLIPEKTEKDRQQNKRTLRKAEVIQKQRAKDQLNQKVDLLSSKDSRNILLSDWFTTCMERKVKFGFKNNSLFPAVRNLLLDFRPEVKLRDVDRGFCLDFIDWLKNTYISPKTKKHLKPFSLKIYCQMLNGTLNDAVREGIISQNPWKLLGTSEKVKSNVHKREFLTIDELKCLMDTPCKNELIKKAFLFSCFTGLRKSDVYQLKWENICLQDTQPYISISMQKTSTPIYIPLSKQALRWLPKKGNATLSDFVFGKRLSETAIFLCLKKLSSSAGINKHITFHCARHTFATMMLTLGADIYTVSKLLGHSSIEMTQIYAEIVDKRKEDAVKLLDSVK